MSREKKNGRGANANLNAPSKRKKGEADDGVMEKTGNWGKCTKREKWWGQIVVYGRLAVNNKKTQHVIKRKGGGCGVRPRWGRGC